jgi:Zn-dependent protease
MRFDTPPRRGYLSRPTVPALSDSPASPPPTARPPPLGLLQTILLVVPVLLLSFTAHEFAHGWAAWKQGDDTAYELGLLNWNPRTYVDPWMTLILPVVTWVFSQGQMIFGGARSAPLDSSRYRHPRLGDVIVSLAGVTANFLLAFLAAGVLVLAGLAGRAVGAAEPTLAVIQAMCVIAIRLNFFLVLFNLLPIPPLDGSHVVKHLLPARLSRGYQRFAPYGLLLLIVLIYTGTGILGWWMSPAIRGTTLLVGELRGFLLPGASQWLG